MNVYEIYGMVFICLFVVFPIIVGLLLFFIPLISYHIIKCKSNFIIKNQKIKLNKLKKRRRHLIKIFKNRESWRRSHLQANYEENWSIFDHN